MTTVEQASTHLPPLGTHVREQVGEELQGLLVELIDLSLLGKQLHWSIVGRHFRELHLQLDEYIDAWHALSDTVAERAVAIGYFPDGQASAVVKGSSLQGLERGAIADTDVVRELTDRLANVVERTRERQERLGELDAASEDVVIQVIRVIEENLWMIRAQFV